MRRWVITLLIASSITVGVLCGSSTPLTLATVPPPPPPPKGVIVYHDLYKPEMQASTTLKRRGLIIFTKDFGSDLRFACLGPRRLHPVRRLLNHVNRFGPDIRGRAFQVAGSRHLQVRWDGELHDIVSVGSRGYRLPGAARHLILELIELRKRLRPKAESLGSDYNGTYTAKALCPGK